MTIVVCNLDFTTNYSRVKGKVFTRCDLEFINSLRVDFCLSLLVGYSWPCVTRTALGARGCAHAGAELPGCFPGHRVEVGDGLRASPRVLFRCVLSSRPASRSSPAPVPLGGALASLGPRAARPASRLFFRVHVPFVFFYIYTLRRPRAESLPFVLLHCYTTIFLHNWCYVRCHLYIVG